MSNLATIGLPSTGVLVEIEQRRRVFVNFEDALSLIPSADRGRAMYLSKFLAAAAAGLFDAALSYLWDETIDQLRSRIVGYDLAYFYDIAVPSVQKRQDFRTADDLPQVGDQDLIRASLNIGLISNVGYQQLDLIRYMRNYASAAHPNQNEITALQLLGWVETCIKEVINLPESFTVAEAKRLLGNVRAGSVSAGSAAATAGFFKDLTSVQADALGAGLFGIYTDTTSIEPARDGVRLLLPLLWPLVSEDQRQRFAAQYGIYVANADAARAAGARELLDVVGASAYLPDLVRVAELSEAIDDLLAAHHAMNNFYNEPGRARRLAALAGDRVPEGVQSAYVRALVEVFLTNGNGVARGADPYYRDMINGFGPDEAEAAVRRLFDPTVASRLRWGLAQTKYAEVLALLDPKMVRPAARELFDAIKAFASTPDNLMRDTSLQSLLARLG